MAHNHTEHVQEEIHHQAAHGHSGPRWITWAALTAAILAAFAAVSASLATRHLTESTLKRIDSNDKWLEYDSDSVKRSVIYSREADYARETAGGTKATAVSEKQHLDDLKKLAEYATLPKDELKPESPQGMKGIQEEAIKLKAESIQHLETHETYETSATMFHIAIAVVAISVVAKRKEFWMMSMAGGAAGLFFFGSAMIHAPVEAHEAQAEHATSAEHASPTASHAATDAAHATAGDHAATAEHHD